MCVSGRAFGSTAFTASRRCFRSAAGEDGSFARAAEAGAEKFHLHHAQPGLLFGDEFLRVQAHERRIVLMHALHRDAIGRDARTLGERSAPRDVRVVQDAGPVHGADHDRLPCAEQDEADRLQRIVGIHRGLDPSAAQRMTDWCGDIETERRDAELRRLRAVRR